MDEGIKVAAEIEALKARMDSVDRRFDKIDTNIQKIWEKIDLHRDGQVKTQTLVEEMSKSMFEMRVDLKNLVEKSNNAEQKHATRWENFWSKASWGLIGILGAIIAAKFGISIK